MAEDLPTPLVPADVDLRGYEFMPLYGSWLKDSDFNARANALEFRAAINLWWASWKQIPASSLPNDDTALCLLAELGRDLKTWRKVKEVAMRGFVLCSDGRFYHKVIGKLAVAAFAERQRAILRGKMGADKRWKKHSGGNAQSIDTAVPKQWIADSKGEGEPTKTSSDTGGSGARPVDNPDFRRSSSTPKAAAHSLARTQQQIAEQERMREEAAPPPEGSPGAFFDAVKRKAASA